MDLAYFLQTTNLNVLFFNLFCNNRLPITPNDIVCRVGHTTTRMIVDHYYRYVPAPDDGKRLEDAWNSTSILPEQDDANWEDVENTV